MKICLIKSIIAIRLTAWRMEPWINENTPELCIALFIILFIAAMMEFRSFRNCIFKNIGIFALIFWCAGLVLYIVGFNDEGSKGNFLILFMRASLSSLEMFASHSDLLEVNKDLHHDPTYMLWFSSIHFMAALTTSLFIFKLFGLRIKNWWRKKLYSKKNRTYVFWGINNESMTLAKDIFAQNSKKQSESAEKSEKCNIVFIIDNEVHNNHKGDTGHLFSFSRILGLSTSYNEETEEIIETYKGIVYRQKKSFSLPSKIRKCEEIEVLFMSDNENANIGNCLNVIKCNTLKKVSYHCHAQRNLVNRRIAKSNGIRLVDSSFLSILELKQNKDTHPVNFVDIETDESKHSTAIVTSEFKAMIIGFGETGKSALAFLYEFSALLGKDGNRSPYNITVIDKDMDSIKGDYLANRPALRTNTNLNFIQSEIGSEQYWNTIDKLISNGLNYVIIALGNDHLNLSAAIRLQEYRMRYIPSYNKPDNGSSKFCIYVKQSKELIEKINELYKGSIVPFGLDKDIFSEKIAINNKYLKDAEKYKQKYDEVKSGKNEENNITKKGKDKNAEIEQPISIESLRKTYRENTQNLSNAYHRHTIIKLFGEDKNLITELNKYERIPSDIKEFDGKYSYRLTEGGKEVSEKITALMTNAAKSEHLRWNAAIEMLGYTQNIEDRSSNNLITMQHNCLTTWEDLEKIWRELKDTHQYCEYKQYDYNVIETSIDIFLNGYKQAKQEPQNKS